MKVVANLYDLRTPTALTLSLTTVFPFDCANVPTVTLDPILIVHGTSFPAQSSSVVSFFPVDNVVSFVFPGITVTALTPGEPLTYTDISGEHTTYHRNCHNLLIQGILFLLTHLHTLRLAHVLQLREQFLLFRLAPLLSFRLIADVYFCSHGFVRQEQWNHCRSCTWCHYYFRRCRFYDFQLFEAQLQSESSVSGSGSPDSRYSHLAFGI